MVISDNEYLYYCFIRIEKCLKENGDKTKSIDSQFICIRTKLHAQ